MAVSTHSSPWWAIPLYRQPTVNTNAWLNCQQRLPSVWQTDPLSGYHLRITEQQRLEDTSGSPLVQPPLLKAAFPRTMSRQLLSISKDGDSTTSLGNLSQGSATLTVTKRFWMFRGDLLCFSVCPLPLTTTEKSLALTTLLSLSSGISTHWWDSPEPSRLQTAQSQFSQPFLTGEMLQPIHHGALHKTVSWTREPKTGHSTPGIASPRLSWGEGSPPCTCWQRFV